MVQQVGKQRERVLFVEDEKVAAFPSIRFLEIAGYAVVHVATVELALAALEGVDGHFQHLIVDLGLGTGCGQDVIRFAETLPYRPAVIALVGPGDSRRTLALRGRCLPLPKPVPVDDLLDALRGGNRTTLRGYALLHGLTEAQTELLEWSIEDLDDEAIAGRLACKPSTIRSHWQGIMERTGCRSRAAVRNDVIRWVTRGETRRSSGVYPSVRPGGSAEPARSNSHSRRRAR